MVNPPSPERATELAALAAQMDELDQAEAAAILARQAAKERLRVAITGCTACSLADTRHWGVPFTSPTEAYPIVLLGGAPGTEEDLTGLPFQGRAGQLLTRCLEAVHLTRETVHTMNTIACRPPRNSWDLAVAAEAPERCAAWFTAQLTLTEAWIVVALGEQAIERMLGEHRGIGREVRAGGRWAGGLYVIPAWHPGYVLAQGGTGASAQQDLVEALRQAADIAIGYETTRGAPSDRALEVVEYLGSKALAANTPKAVKAARHWWRSKGFIPVWSPVLNSDVVVTAHRDVRVPDGVRGIVFTVDELEKLSRLVDGGETLRRVAAVKQVMGAEVVW